ncbi:hypothetical protein ACT009_01415 [Sphingomonas sp. Tas61C01]|uniref:hypothetical protein n=1 Tax=Sphingomonas sp. Tas61C01 TaxID=3458297 RepID=UPI00403EA3B3
MKKLAIIGAALAFASPMTVNAATDCGNGGTGDCCADMKHRGDHDGHDVQMAAAK